jgi:hypothetical protein
MIAAGVLPADAPPDFGYVTDAAQKQAQERLAKLVPNEARHQDEQRPRDPQGAASRGRRGGA